MIFNYKILAILFTFLLGLIYYINSRKIMENLSNNTQENTPKNYKTKNKSYRLYKT